MVIVKSEVDEKVALGNVEFGKVFKFDGRYYMKIKPMIVEHPRYDANINRMVLDFEYNEICIMQVDTLVVIVDAELRVDK